MCTHLLTTHTCTLDYIILFVLCKITSHVQTFQKKTDSTTVINACVHSVFTVLYISCVALSWNRFTVIQIWYKGPVLLRKKMYCWQCKHGPLQERTQLPIHWCSQLGNNKLWTKMFPPAAPVTWTLCAHLYCILYCLGWNSFHGKFRYIYPRKF